MYTFVRHSIKSHTNNSKGQHRLDADITREGVQLSKSKAKMLRNKGFVRIVTSPYLRCRRTAEVMSKILGIEEIVVDPLLSEYLGNQKTVTEDDFMPETLAYDPSYPETFTQFEDRMRRFVESLDRTDTIYVTHGLNIITIASLMSVKFKDPPRMGWFYQIPCQT